MWQLFLLACIKYGLATVPDLLIRMEDDQAKSVEGPSTTVISGPISASDVVDGMFGKAIKFNGGPHLEVDVSAVSCFKTITTCSNGISGSMWIQPQTKTFQPSEYYYPDEEYMNNGGEQDLTPGFYFRYDGMLGKYEVGIRRGTQLFKVSFKLQEMYWHEVFWAHTSGYLRVYVNGKRIQEITGASAAAVSNAANAATGKIIIGKGSKAILDEVAFWQTSVTYPTDNVGCLPGFTHSNFDCFLILRANQSQSWNASQALCEKYGGHLAIIKTETHKTDVAALITGISATSSYVGLNDWDLDGEFIWYDGLFGPTNLQPEAPRVGNCTVFTTGKKFESLKCDTNHSAVCSASKSSTALKDATDVVTTVQAPTNCTISFESSYASNRIKAESPFKFKASSSIGPVESMIVNMGDGTTVEAMGDSFTYIYSTPGDRNISYLVANSGGSYSCSQNVTVDDVSSDFEIFDVHVTDAKPNENVTVAWSNRVNPYANGTCLLMELQYGNGAVDIMNIAIGQSVTGSMEYAYTTAGEYNLSATIDYGSGYVQSTRTVNIASSLVVTNAPTYVNARYGYDFDIAYTANGTGISASLYKGTTEITGCVSTFNSSTNSGKLTVPFSQFNCAGSESLKLVVSDGIHHETKFVTVNLETPISNLFLTSEQQNYVFNDTSNITLTYGISAGSNVEFYIVFDDTNEVFISPCGDVSGKNYTIQHTFMTAGVYTVFVLASNSFYEVTASRIIRLEYTMSPINLTWLQNDTDIATYGIPPYHNATLIVTPENPTFLPQGFRMMMTYGSPSKVKDEPIFNTSFTPTYSFNLMFATPGDRPVHVRLYSLSHSNATATVKVRLYDAMTFIPSKFIAAVNEEITFNVSNITGVQVTYSFEAEGQSPQEENKTVLLNPTYAHTFKTSFNKTGIMTVTAKVSSRSYNLTKSVDILIEPHIMSLDMEVKNKSIPLPGATVNMQFKQNSSAVFSALANCTITYGDNRNRTETKMTLNVSDWHPFRHTYATTGTFTIFVECSNNVSSVNKTTTVTVNPLNLTVNPRSIIYNNTGAGLTNFQIIDNMTTYITPGLSAVFTYGDSNTNTEVLSAWTKSHSYAQRGNYSFSVTVTYNPPDGEQQQTKTLSEMLVIGLLHFNVSDHIVNTATETVSVMVWGWVAPYKYTVDWADGSPQSSCSSSSGSCPNPATFTRTYTTPGVYYIQVFGSDNTVGTEKLIHNRSITVQHPVGPNVLQLALVKNKLILPNETAGFTVSVTATNTPTNATCTMNFGDTGPTDSSSQTFEAGRTKSYAREYKNHLNLNGNHKNVTANVSCVNLVSSWSDTVPLQLFEAITVFKVTPEMKIAEIGYPVQFVLSVATGSDLQFNISFGDGNYQELTGSGYSVNHRHPYMMVGFDFMVNARVWNPMQTVQLPEFKMIVTQTMFVPIENYTVTAPEINYIDYITGKAIVPIKVVAGEALVAPDNVSIVLDYGDLNKTIGPLEMMLTYPYAYYLPGKYTVKLTVYLNNTEETRTVETTLNVTYACLSPVAAFPHLVRNASSPYNLFLGLPVVISASLTVYRCRYGSHAHIWKFYGITNPSYRNSFTTTGTVLQVVKETLPPGEFRVELIISVDGKSSNASMYLRLNRSPLEAKIKGGSYLEVNKNQQVTIDATDSYDPDKADPKNIAHLSFAWACKQLTTAEENSDPAGITMDPTCITPFSATNKNTLGFNSNLLTADKQYLFRLTMTSSDSRQSITYQKIKALSVRIPAVEIKFLSPYKGKINVDQTTKLEGTCKSCTASDPVPNYVWSVMEDLPAPVAVVPNQAGQSLVIERNKFAPGKKYIFKLEAHWSTNTAAKGMATLNSVGNHLPRRGNCTVNRPKGSIFETFTFDCHGWLDEENAQNPGSASDKNHSLTYQISVDGKKIAFANNALQLPLKDYLLPSTSEETSTKKVVATVCDIYGGCSTSETSIEISNPVADIVNKIAASSPTDSKNTLTATEEQSIVGLIENYVGRAEEDDAFPLKTLMFQQGLTAFASSFSKPNVEAEPTETTATSPEEEAANIAKTTNSLTGEMAAVAGSSGSTGANTGGSTNTGSSASGVSEAEIGSYGQVLLNIGRKDSATETQVDKTVKAAIQASLSRVDTLTQAVFANNGSRQDESITKQAIIMASSILESSAANPRSMSDESMGLGTSVMSNSAKALFDLPSQSAESMNETAKAVLNGLGSLSNSVSNNFDAGSGEGPEDNAVGEVDFAGVGMTEESIAALEQQEASEPRVSPQEVEYFAMIRNRRNAVKSDDAEKRLQEHAAKILEAAATVTKAVSKSAGIGEGPWTYGNKEMNVSAVKINQADSSSTVASVGNQNFSFPRGFGSNSTTEAATISAVAFKRNIYGFLNGSADINGGMTHLAVTERGAQAPVPAVLFSLQQPSTARPKQIAPAESKGDPSKMSYLRIYVPNPQNTLSVTLRQDDSLSASVSKDCDIYLQVNTFPSLTKFAAKKTVSMVKGVNTIVNFSPSERPTGVRYYLGLSCKVKFNTARRKRSVNGTASAVNNTLVKNALVGLGIDLTNISASNPDLNQTAVVDGTTYTVGQLITLYNAANGNFAVQSAATGCRTNDDNSWNSNSCKVTATSTPDNIQCHCEKPEKFNFAASFVVAPNMIDFNMVFSNWDPSNVGVLLACLVVVLVYIPLAVCCRRLDKRDIVEWGVTKLLDNKQGHSHYYLMSIYTGMRGGSATRSKIGFSINGEKGETGFRLLYDGLRRELKRGSVKRFLLAVPKDLGKLNYVHIWHDNSGGGSFASWFLDRIVVQDLQDDTGFVFVCDEWLAVDKSDGEIERILPAAGKDNLMSPKALFMDNVKLTATDDHLWLSLLTRPSPSNFTRLQRLSCVMTLLFMAMIANAMFYGTDGSEERPVGINVGPFKFTLGQIFTSLMSILIITPVNLLVINLFKRAKPRSKTFHKNLQDSLKQKNQNKHQELEAIEEADEPPKRRFLLCCGKSKEKETFVEATDSEVLDQMLVTYINENGLSFPWWTTIIGWVLVVLIVLASSFFCILYSQQWGKEKANEWIIAFFISAFQDMFVLDPVKVCMIAGFLALVFRKPALQMESVDQTQLKADEEYVSQPSDGENAADVKNKYIGTAGLTVLPPLAQDTITRLRRKKLKERRLYELIQEVIVYVLFLLVIWTISYSNRDPEAFKIYDIVAKNIIDNDGGFRQVRTPSDYLQWIKDQLIPWLFAYDNYDGNRFHWRQRRFVQDLDNYRLGPARLRQLRMPHVPAVDFYGTPYNTYGAYSPLKADSADHCIGWSSTPCNPDEKTYNFSSEAWKYTKATEVSGVPMWGQFNIYSGGGYVANLDVNRDVSKLILKELWDNLWLDWKTRMVFLEFTLYNANANMFCSLTLMSEFPEFGGITQTVRIYTFRVYVHQGNTGMFVIACEILFICYLIYLIVRTVKRMYHKGCKSFFGNGWHVIDFLLIIGSFAAIAMYFIRAALTDKILRNFRVDATEYVNFQIVAMWDEYFNIVLALLVFVYTMKLIGLLNVNKHMGSLLSVLRVGKEELISYTVMFIVVFLAFSQLGWLLFGTDSKYYATMMRACEELLSTMLGKINLQTNKGIEFESTGAQTYYMLYILVSTTILANTLICIIVDAINSVNAEGFDISKHLQLIDFIIYRVKEMFGFDAHFDFDNFDLAEDEDSPEKGPFDGPRPVADEQAELWYRTLSLQINEIMSHLWRTVQNIEGQDYEKQDYKRLLLSSEYSTVKSPEAPPT